MAALHTVYIDEAAIAATFARYQGEAAPGIEGEHIPRDDTPPPANPWEGEAYIAAAWLAGRASNWDIDPARVEKMGRALADLGARYFPGGPPNLDKWGPWARLAFEAGHWLLQGVDWQTRTFVHPWAPTGPAPDQGDQPDRPFSTGDYSATPASTGAPFTTATDKESNA